MPEPVTLFRIAADTAHYHADDLSGAGAKRDGGRWNSPGTAVCYASTSIALAALETLVHLTAGLTLPLNRVLVSIRIPRHLWDARETFDPDIPSHVGWNVSPPGLVSIRWGDRWAVEGRSCLASVPSVIVREEQNVLINPAHADATAITAMKLRAWSYDPRFV